MPEDVDGDVVGDTAGDVVGAVADEAAAVGVESTLVEIRQALIDAGGDPTYVYGLDERGIYLVLHMGLAGHSISSLCPAPQPARYYRHAEHDEH
jgi:hypothetical protein